LKYLKQVIITRTRFTVCVDATLTNCDNYRYHVQLSDSILLYRERQRYAILLDQHFVGACPVSPVHLRKMHLPFRYTGRRHVRHFHDISRGFLRRRSRMMSPFCVVKYNLLQWKKENIFISRYIGLNLK